MWRLVYVVPFLISLPGGWVFLAGLAGGTNVSLYFLCLGFATVLAGPIIGALLENGIGAERKIASLEQRIAQLEKENKR